MDRVERSIECPGCGADEISTGTGISGSVCDRCGLVYDGTDWPTEIADENVVQKDNQPQSSTDHSNSDWQHEIEVADASDQQLVSILSDFDNAVNSLSLSDETRAKGANIVTQAWNRNITHGRRVESVVAATIYLSCRKTGELRPSHTIADTTQADEQRIHDISRVLAREMSIDLTPDGACGYIAYLADELGVAESSASEASKRLTNMDYIGGEPAAIAAATLYVVSDSDAFTLIEAGEAAGVTKETVWRHTKRINQQR